MKELMQAFQSLDLARLLMLERERLVALEMNAGPDGGLGADELKQQRVALENRSQALCAQLEEAADKHKPPVNSPQSCDGGGIPRLTMLREVDPSRH